MEFTYPGYYEKFRCIGSECNDNCCAAGWQIAIDEESLKMYEKMEGDIGVRIRNSIDWENGLFEQFDKKCALLNENGLCDVYCDAGEDKMCILCQRYPRHFEEYENLREISLSVSCPVACKLVLENRGRLTTYTNCDDTEEEYEDFDYLMFTVLQNVRELLLDVVSEKHAANQINEVSLSTRLLRTLFVTHEVQKDIDKDEIFFIDDKVEEIREELANGEIKLPALSFVQKNMKERRTYLRKMLESLHKLEVLKSSWTDLINETINLLYEELDEETYEKLTRDFNAYYADREEEYEQLMAYFVYTYFCGSVYDYEPESKVRFGIAAILIIHELDMAFFYKNGKLDMDDQIEIVHRYSKEVEHSDLNLDDMERMVMRDSAFGLKKMYTCISGTF